MSESREPVPFEVYEEGVYLHGTKAGLAVGDLLAPGRESNFEPGRVMSYVYFTATLDAAVWGAELASGAGRGRIYVVEPTGELEDDPNEEEGGDDGSDGDEDGLGRWAPADGGAVKGEGTHGERRFPGIGHELGP